jgi:hypothetical protein
MKRTFITHVTKDYLEVALNLAKSIRYFSELPLIVYCIDLDDGENYFKDIPNVHVRNINLNLKQYEGDQDYIFSGSGNFYVNRSSHRIYHILCAKTLAMELALEEGWDEICYLDSDCLATPLVDEIFEWSSTIKDYPIATEGIHEYMLIIKDGVQIGNPFEGTWPIADNTKSLEWPLMNFLEMSPESRGIYRTTGIMLMNQKCLPFIKTWRELCFMLPKLVNLERYAPYHEETIYNVLSWKKTNEGFPLCYVNIGEGLETVKHTYSENSEGGDFSWDDENHSQRFYMIPEDKRNIKVLHGEKRSSEVNLILEYLKNIK